MWASVISILSQTKHVDDSTRPAESQNPLLFMHWLIYRMGRIFKICNIKNFSIELVAS